MTVSKRFWTHDLPLEFREDSPVYRFIGNFSTFSLSAPVDIYMPKRLHFVVMYNGDDVDYFFPRLDMELLKGFKKKYRATVAFAYRTAIDRGLIDAMASAEEILGIKDTEDFATMEECVRFLSGDSLDVVTPFIVARNTLVLMKG